MKNVWVVIITFVVSALILGVGGYYYLSSKHTAEENDLKSRIESLQAEVDGLKTSASDSNGELTAEQAVTKVRELPAVGEYLADVPDGRVEYDHEDTDSGSWVVHVYEIVDGHTATNNWYNVDKITGEVSATF